MGGTSHVVRSAALLLLAAAATPALACVNTFQSALRYGATNKVRVELRSRRFAAAYPGDQWIDQFESIRIR